MDSSEHLKHAQSDLPDIDDAGYRGRLVASRFVSVMRMQENVAARSTGTPPKHATANVIDPVVRT
jgi:hypothetical protein